MGALALVPRLAVMFLSQWRYSENEMPAVGSDPSILAILAIGLETTVSLSGDV